MFLHGSGGSTPPSGTINTASPGSPAVKRDQDSIGFLTHVKWSLVMLVATVAIAAVSIPILRWFGIGTD